MSERITLSTQTYRVVLGKYEDESTWRELVVRSIFRDQTFAETEFARLKVTPAEHALRFSAAVCYFALRRTGQIQGGSFTDFEQGVLSLDVDEEEPVDPTPSAPSPG